jgi:adenylate cyclase
VKPEIVDILVSTPDEEKALAGARRPISVLFVDVRGFTAMSEQMEPEQVLAALDVYLEELTQSVTKYDGLLDKYVGDEIMALWNAPRYQENHAMLAVMSALDMISRTERINEQLRAQGLPAIGYGIGVNTGEAVVGQMGSSIRKQYDVIGDAINTGARLCSAAGREEIIIGENTWELIGDRLVVEETEPLKLKGKSRPFRTFRVIGIAAQAAPLPEPAPAPA